MPDWTELVSRGFVHLPGFLSPPQVQALCRDFESGPPAQDHAFGFKPVARRQLRALLPTLQAILEQVAAATDLRVDVFPPFSRSHYITTRLAQRTSHWHQDFDLDYRLTGDHRQSLNFWIPLVKPRKDLSNLSLIPWDRLRQGETSSPWEGRGGTRWVTEGDATQVLARPEGQILSQPAPPLATLDFRLETLQETPWTEVGDLLLLRGDLIHRTQDSQTERLAVSLRASSTQKWLSRQRVLALEGEEQLQNLILKCLDHSNQEQVTVGQYLSWAQGESP